MSGAELGRDDGQFPAAFSRRMRRTSSMASGLPCTEWPDVMTFSETASGMCALEYFTTPSSSSSRGLLPNTGMIE